MRRRIIPDVLRERKMVSVGEKTTVREAAKLMCEHDVGAVPIIEEKVLKGIPCRCRGTRPRRDNREGGHDARAGHDQIRYHCH
jgi:CBS domain-containing protein